VVYIGTSLLAGRADEIGQQRRPELVGEAYEEGEEHGTFEYCCCFTPTTTRDELVSTRRPPSQNIDGVVIER
jgi:hypothetical protein